ncbi:MAG: disulfide bond formation protein B [Pseudomonadota bacterium]
MSLAQGAAGLLARPSRAAAALAAAGSAGLLAGAFFFQHAMGLAPCPMCIWQRWPHAVGAALGPALLIPALRRLSAVPLLGLAAMAVSAGLALLHTGVERGWWDGPSTCAGGQDAGMSTDELLQAILEAPLVRCTDVAWEMAGLSMASWNGLASLGLLALWAAAARAGGRARG